MTWGTLREPVGPVSILTLVSSRSILTLVEIKHCTLDYFVFDN